MVEIIQGIYRIELLDEELRNPEVIYIGQATNVWFRCKRNHLSELKGNRHRNKLMQSIYNKYGRNNDKRFRFQLHEIVENYEDLDKIEIFWIAVYKPRCNFTKGGKLNPSKRVRCLETNQIFSNASEAIRKMNLKTHENNINRACQGNGISSSGFHWEYVDSPHSDEYKQKIMNEFFHTTKAKPIRCINTGETFINSKEAAYKLGFSPSLHKSIRRVCTGERYSFRGLFFEYIDNPHSEEYKNRIMAINRKPYTKDIKQILCIDSGEIFESAKDIVINKLKLQFTQGKVQQITDVCNGKFKTAFGLHFKYIDSEDNIKQPIKYIDSKDNIKQLNILNNNKISLENSELFINFKNTINNIN